MQTILQRDGCRYLSGSKIAIIGIYDLSRMINEVTRNPRRATEGRHIPVETSRPHVKKHDVIYKSEFTMFKINI